MGSQRVTEPQAAVVPAYGGEAAQGLPVIANELSVATWLIKTLCFPRLPFVDLRLVSLVAEALLFSFSLETSWELNLNLINSF